MDAGHWARVQELFHTLADATRDEQEDALSHADPAVAADTRRLLAADREASLLDRDVGHLAAHLVGGNTAEVRAIGPYRLTEVLGAGGMGVVYRGEREDLATAVAIKLLPDAWLSPVRRDRFLQEQRTLAQLVHPGIAQLYDAGTLPSGTPWIAMELVEGVPLTAFATSRQLDVVARLRLVRQVCDAVAFAHQHLVVHRDLKPSNVLVRTDGSVKLLDFGIAKQLDTTQPMTLTGAPLMTPAYAAPEQLRGEPVGVHSDVYALGVILFELLTGALPHDVAQHSPREAAARIAAAPLARPSSHPGALPAPVSQWADLDVLCGAALHPEVGRRYRSVEALARDIDAFLNGMPLAARPDSLRYRSGKFLRRHRRAVTAAAAVAVAIGSLIGFYTVRLARARDSAIAEQVRAQRIQRFMTDLFRGRDPDAGPADSLRVITLLEQGVLEARSLDREPEVQTDLYETLGGIYQQLGQLDRADSLLTTAYELWQRHAGATSRPAARAAMLLGDLRTDQARYGAADTLLRHALATLRRLPPGQGATVMEGEVLVALGRALTERGAHDTAIAILDTATALLARVAPDTREQLGALSELANATFYAGNYDRADSVNRRVLALTQRLYGDRHPLIAEDLMNLGATEQERGNYTESERLFREALAITTAFHGETHYRTASNVLYLGRSLLLQNRKDEARAAMQRALAIRERVYPPNHPAIANTLNELGSLAVREERYDEAREIYQRVRAIYTAAYPGKNFRTGVSIANLADTYLYQQDYPRAVSLYREALTHYIASQGPDHLNTGIGYIKLGRGLLRSGQFRAAEPEIRRGYAIVAKVAEPTVSFLQAARLDLSIVFDSTARPDSAAKYRAERERYIPR